MNIFDEMSPEQILQLLSINQGNNGLDLTITGQQPNIWNPQTSSHGLPEMPTLPSPPEMPEFPEIGGGSGESDISGFVSYGMKPPELPDPMKQIQGIMGMMGDPNINRKEDPIKRRKPGGLMSYLQSLGV